MLAVPRGESLGLFNVTRGQGTHGACLGLLLSQTSSGLILHSFTGRGGCVVLKRPNRWNYWSVTSETRYEIARLFLSFGPPI